MAGLLEATGVGDAAGLVGWSSVCTLSARVFHKFQGMRRDVPVSMGMRHPPWRMSRRVETC